MLYFCANFSLYRILLLSNYAANTTSALCKDLQTQHANTKLAKKPRMF